MNTAPLMNRRMARSRVSAGASLSSTGCGWLASPVAISHSSGSWAISCSSGLQETGQRRRRRRRRVGERGVELRIVEQGSDRTSPTK